MKLFDSIPFWVFAVAAVMMAIAPLFPMPHLAEKVLMLLDGNLVKPIDIFDLFWHSLFPILLLVKSIRMGMQQKSAS